eukprot:1158744-Pelagomonas_calceolata.AAC.5
MEELTGSQGGAKRNHALFLVKARGNDSTLKAGSNLSIPAPQSQERKAYVRQEAACIKERTTI